jgi:ABC-type glycerol-3-phosphate transport system substrate-binding protein
MKRNALMVLALVMAIALVAAGCGSSGDDSDNALTKSEFLAKGNAICDAGNKEVNAAFEEAIGKGRPTQEQLNSVVTDSLVPSIQGQIDDIRDLDAPEGDDGQIGQILDEAELALQDVRENPSLATQEGGQDPFESVNKQLNDYGLSTCGNTE